MANWSNPVLTSTYTNFVTEVKDRDVDLALQFDGTTSTNLPTNTIRWNSTQNRWQKWSGSAWGELTTTYALTGLSTTGNATIAGTLGVTGATTLTGGGTSTTVATADNSTAIATTAFVKAQNYAPLASPTLTGTPAAPTAAVNTNTTQIATTAFVNAEIANDAVLIGGSTMTGALTLSGDPTAENHATTKHWVESRAFKDSCRVATTAALTVTATATTLTNAGTLAAISIDGIALSVGDRVLVKDQATTNQNGIYTVTTVGSGAIAWVLTRGTDSDVWNDLVSAVTAIDQGTVNDNTMWMSTTVIGGTLGTTAVTFQLLSNAQVAALGNFASNGLVARTAANTFTARSIAVSGTGLSVSNADGVAGNPTVTSNATNANTASTIVARDASGNFSAGSITLAGINYSGNIDTTSTGYLELPVGTTAQRPGTPATGMVRFNSSISQFEGYSGAAWGNIGIGATGAGNRVLNGSMAVDQRNAGASQTFTAAAALAYSVDRWYGYCTGANVTGQQVQGATAGQYRYRFTGAASVTAIGFGQRIEQLNSADLAGTTATLSVDLANSVLTSVTWTAFYATTANAFGTLASPTRTQIATGTFTVTSTVTRYNTNISIPAAATTGIEIVFTVGAQTSGTWTIGNVQLEAGSVATPFERRSYGQELALCQRYFQQLGAGMTGFEEGNTTHSYGLRFMQLMRAAPTFSLISSSFSYRYIDASGVGDRTITVSINGFTSISPQGAWLYFNDVSTGSVLGRGAMERSGSNYINASAEL